MTTPKTFLATLMAFVMLLGSCASSRTASDGSLSDANGTGVRKTGTSKTTKGGLIGAGGGAAAGAILGGLLGGGRGTAAGAIWAVATGVWRANGLDDCADWQPARASSIAALPYCNKFINCRIRQI